MTAVYLKHLKRLIDEIGLPLFSGTA